MLRPFGFLPLLLSSFPSFPIVSLLSRLGHSIPANGSASVVLSHCGAPCGCVSSPNCFAPIHSWLFQQPSSSLTLFRSVCCSSRATHARHSFHACLCRHCWHHESLVVASITQAWQLCTVLATVIVLAISLEGSLFTMLHHLAQHMPMGLWPWGLMANVYVEHL